MSYENYVRAQFEELKGKTIKFLSGHEQGSEELHIECTDGSEYRMIYHHDCCASCSIEEIIGDVQDLFNSPVLMAEEISSSDPDESVIADRKAKYEKERSEWEEKYPGIYHWPYGPNPDNGFREESETWCFYKLGTIKGSVTIRWYGSSNGYYSESATFEKRIK